MNESMNLCEILKGHEGETFYSSICGTIVLLRINSDGGIIFKSLLDQCVPYAFNEDGTFISGAECVIFPSKDQRDWNKWIEEQKSKVPKTWSDLVKENKYQPYFAEIHSRFSLRDKCAYGKNSVEKSAAALLKIHQLIEVGYGGNITNEEWNSRKEWFVITCYDFETSEIVLSNRRSHIAFHTREQAEEFLSHPENIQLLKDYFMVYEMFS